MKILTLVVSLLLSLPAISGTGSGKITKIFVHGGGVFMFNVEVHNNKPACNTAGNEWAMTLATEVGKAMYSLILTAAAQGKSISVYGAGACSSWSDREQPSYIYIN